MTRSYGSGPDRPHREKKPDLRASEPDDSFDSRLDSRLSRYAPDEDTRVQAVRVDFGKRLVAMIIDVAAAYAVSAIVLLIPFASAFLNTYLVLVLVLLVKDFFFEGRGIGKNLMGLQVVDVRTGQPCSLLQAIRRNMVVLGPLLALFAVGLVMQILTAFLHIPANIQEGVNQVVYTIGTVYTILVIPYEAYRVYSRADGRRFGDSFAGTALVEAPMDFSKPLPRQ